ncbi:amino acid ABC transporter permease [Halobacteriovorax marinus]|uniref:Amino acid ABC transporter permease n=1 Tax=Halobacteriovorax marinus TaxID=97084 RepID=A0A1Y5F3Z7_9BACT|nr:amino acid ABC transporter permease [Halobacteriovorax marinus]
MFKSKALRTWCHKNLFNSKMNSFLSVVIVVILFKFLSYFYAWFVTNAVWIGDAAACREASGACVVFIKEKYNFILFGFYPRAEIYRPILCIVLLLSLVIYSSYEKNWKKCTLILWALLFLVSTILMGGGIFSLPIVESDQWGGLPLTLILSVVGIFVSYPLGIVLALGRRSKMPIIRIFSTCYIELIRGVPMISLLFMSSVMFPLFLPEGVVIDKIIRAQIAIIMFVCAYMAEVVRGGLQAIPRGQYEAAEALGLNYFQTMRLVILPQALKVVIPPTVNTVIGMFKDTSLVIIIALFDLMSTMKTALKDPEWLGFNVEGYIFIALIYFMFCFSMGKYSRTLEKKFNRKGTLT